MTTLRCSCLQIKYIADPGMHSIPSVSVHPNGKWLCGQSLDNQIVTYSALDRFRINRKKVFKGHTSSGYACQVCKHPADLARFCLSVHLLDYSRTVAIVWLHALGG